MIFRTKRWSVALALLLASGLATFGCSGEEGNGNGTAGTGGAGGTTGTGGTGGTEGATIQMPQCILDGYQALYREFWGSPSNGLHYILRYVDEDGPLFLDSSVIQVKAQLAANEVLDPFCQADPPRPRVLWSTFNWPWTGPTELPKYEALFFQAMDEGICESRSFRLDDGFYQGTVAVVDWEIGKEDQKVGEDKEKIGAGTFSVYGLDHESVRVTLVQFPYCRIPEEDPPLPANSPLLCADPEDPNDPYYHPETNHNPWYDEGVGCRFEVTSLGIHVDLNPGSDPFVFSMEFIADFGGVTEVRGLMVGSEDGTVDVSGTYNGQPVTIVFDFDTGEMTIELTGEPKKDCTFDTDTAEISECV